MKHLILFLLCILPALVSSAQEKFFESDKAGWTMTIPAGWERIPENRVGVQPEMPGMNAANEGLLLMLIKDKRSVLMAYMQPYKWLENEWDARQKRDNQRSYKAFEQMASMLTKKSKIDSSTRHETIGNRSFRIFETKAYTPDGKMVLNQLSYARLYAGNGLTVTITVGNESDRKVILDAWKRSVFKD